MTEKQSPVLDQNGRFKPFNKPETLTSMAAKYKVTYETFRKWIKPIEKQINFSPRRTFTPAEVKMIIEFLGEYDVDS